MDEIVEKVRKKLLDRSNVGLLKYNTTLQSNNKLNYLLEIQHELLDACNYIEKVISMSQEIIDIVSAEPDNQKLGEKIRKIVT